MAFTQVPTVISKSSQAIRAIRDSEPELTPLIPAEPSFNRTAYERWLEGIIKHLVTR